MFLVKKVLVIYPTFCLTVFDTFSMCSSNLASSDIGVEVDIRPSGQRDPQSVHDLTVDFGD